MLISGKHCCRRGFALIATISVMVLLVMIALAMLSLSTIELRASQNGRAMAEAQANARMALMLAIGELQKHSGSDTRVTARADILDENNPPLLGVWKSWQGDDHEKTGSFAGRPISIGNYTQEKQNRFLAWLTSSYTDDPTTVPDTGKATHKVTLVGEGSVGNGAQSDKLQIHLEPTPVGESSKSGRLAWWIGGENQKARVPKPYSPDNNTVGRWASLAKSHTVADPKTFRLEPLLADAALAEKALTLRQADLMGTPEADTEALSREFFYDLSAVSVGLLTNTATGGWRKDLSILTENWAAQPRDASKGLPMFQLTPTTQTQSFIPTQSSAVPAGSMLYPWASYRGGNSRPIYQHGPVTSWENLVNYATHYKRISATSSGRLTTPTHSVHIFGNSYDFLHRVRILPVIARVHWVLSHSAGAIANDDEKLQPRMLLTPVITIWNPYSMALTSPNLTISVPKTLPIALRYTINGAPNTHYNCLTTGSYNNKPSLSNSGSLRYSIVNPGVFMPGETRLFSPASITPVASGGAIALTPGYRNGGGHYFPVKDNNGQALALPRTASIKVEAKFDTEYNDVARGVGIYLDMNAGHGWDLAYRMIFTPAVANVIYPPMTNLAGGTLGEFEGQPKPFLSTVFGARMASRTHLAAKGFVQSSPLVNYNAMGRKDEVESTIRRHYGGTAHPVNSPFDFSFIKHPPGGDSDLPNADNQTNRGYIVTGFNKSDGLSRCVIAELPSRPLISLGELVNWDLRYENPIPPYAFNLIGNSDATPLIPADAVVNSRDANLTVNLQYDDSYCANHLLFDDWFFSSIAPDPTHFGTSGRDQKQNYTDFITGVKPLANRAYLPISEDQSTNNSAAASVYQAEVAKVDSWKTIASRLEVEGMFNINSTSVKAWRALLGHARNQRVPYIHNAGGNWQSKLSDETDYVFSRFSIAGDTEAGTPGTSGIFKEATEFAGYRTVDEAFLDAMAEEVVKQVRARGPFLSLSEFINRQLSYGDLALAGTIQAALNELSKNPATDPFKDLKALSSEAVANPDNPRLNPPNVVYDEEYSFPQAAVGHSAYGLPGWTRQADILRPLAPILSARDDTFTIRAYGDARDANGKIIATAVCEAVVRRTREFVDPAEAANITTAPTRPINTLFGRRYQILSFRWLANDEV